MELRFSDLKFDIINNKIYLSEVGSFAQSEGRGFCELQISGENKCSHLGVKMINSSEADKLCYVSHTLTDEKLVIVQRSELAEVETTFVSYGDCKAVQISTRVTNIANEPIVLEGVSSFAFSGIGSYEVTEDVYFTRFIQSHHGECQPETYSFSHLGLYRANVQSQKRIAFANVGSWSTKEELPQGIIEDKTKGQMLMFQIESNNSWYYEIGDYPHNQKYYLYLGGANSTHGNWSKKLESGESYTTYPVSIALGSSLNELLGEMTKHRRHIAGRCAADENLPSIFNEYMHLSWDSPSEATTAIYAPVVASTGVEYYVIDCGWHDEEDANILYHYVGKWRESGVRFPAGVRKTMDYIRSLGMKPGLWIEPEVVGWKCTEMIEYYDKDCFVCRYGKPVCVNNRLFLDYRNPKVVDYMSETIRYMVEDLGAEYIKLDYNQDCGIGTEIDSLTFGEGLESASRAYLVWIDCMRARFPSVLFETCSSGGMRMDYGTLSHFSIISTSDQTNYKKYPYIAGNILSAVIPEQAAVWSYPIDSWVGGFSATKEWVAVNVSDEQVIMNMINSFLGRMHLASHLELFDEHKLALIREGVDYYNSMVADKKKALPYLPIGFTKFGKKLVASGLKTDKKLYLAVWNLGGERDVEIPLTDIAPKSARIAYPASNTGNEYSLKYSLYADKLSIKFTEDIQARMFEIEL
ncbi:MAG: alpha-galactosidase [Clostridia bacterium]|nr:alpha-galactosidase [Clostridia bacterium]